MSNDSYRTIAIPTSVANAVRATRVSPGYGHPAYADIAAGYGPCRHCLRMFRVGEERRILFTYDPFEDLDEAPLPGPVFVHESPCDRYPPDAGVPEELKAHPLTLDAYGQHRSLVMEVRVEGPDIDQHIERLFGHREVEYIHVRDTSAGCYDFRVERASDGREAVGVRTSWNACSTKESVPTTNRG